MLRLVALPKLERLETTQPIMHHRYEHRPKLHLWRQVLQLRELICWEICLSKEVLELIISHAPHLRLLNIPSVTPVYVDDSPFCMYGFLRTPRRLEQSELLELLRPIRKTLQHLCLRDVPWAEAICKVDSLDLSTFKNLQVLEIPGYLVIGQHDTLLEMSASHFSRLLPPTLTQIHIKISGDQGLLYTPTELASTFGSSEDDWDVWWKSRKAAMQEWLDDLTRAPSRPPALRKIGAYEYACCSDQRHDKSFGGMCGILAAEWNLEPTDPGSGINLQTILRFSEWAATELPRPSSIYLEHFYGVSRAPGVGENGKYYTIPEGVEPYEDAIFSADGHLGESPMGSPRFNASDDPDVEPDHEAVNALTLESQYQGEMLLQLDD